MKLIDIVREPKYLMGMGLSFERPTIVSVEQHPYIVQFFEKNIQTKSTNTELYIPDENMGVVNGRLLRMWGETGLPRHREPNATELTFQFRYVISKAHTGQVWDKFITQTNVENRIPIKQDDFELSVTIEKERIKKEGAGLITQNILNVEEQVILGAEQLLQTARAIDNKDSTHGYMGGKVRVNIHRGSVQPELDTAFEIRQRIRNATDRNGDYQDLVIFDDLDDPVLTNGIKVKRKEEDKGIAFRDIEL